MALDKANPRGKPVGGKKGKTLSSSMQECPAFCEGWLEKYSLGRSMFSSKGWHRRYFFMSPEGLGYAHKNPRVEKSSGAREAPAALIDNAPTSTAREQKANLRFNLFPYKRPIKASAAKCFIPFDRKLTTPTDGHKVSSGPREAALLPVYFLENVDVAQHPEMSALCKNGICCEKAGDGHSSIGSSGGGGGGGPHLFSSSDNSAGQEPVGEYFYYFALSFEEKKKRFLLLMRTQNVQVYLKFKYYFRMYVHEASRYCLVPVAHPLEVNKAVPTDMNRKRITHGGAGNHGEAATSVTAMNTSTAGNTFNLTDFAVGGSAMQLSYYRDPDPCSSEELQKIKRLFFEWNDGTRERVMSTTRGSSDLATLVRQLALPLAECEKEIQATRQERADAFIQRSVLDAFQPLGEDIPEEAYERDNREAAALTLAETTGLGGSGHRSEDTNHNHNNNNSDTFSPLQAFNDNSASGVFSRAASGPHFVPQAKRHHEVNGNINNGKTGAAAAGKPANRIVYSEASGDDGDDAERPQPLGYLPHQRKPSYTTAVYTNAKLNGKRSPNLNGHGVVVADRREAVQEASGRQRIIISSSFGNVGHNSGIDEGSGIIATRV